MNQKKIARFKTGEKCAMTLEVSANANTVTQFSWKLFYIVSNCDTYGPICALEPYNAVDGPRTISMLSISLLD